MEILVNDQIHQPTEAVQTVAQLAQELCENPTLAGRQFVVSVRCDGQDVPPEQLETVLQQPLADFQKIELQTQRGSALIRQTLVGTHQLFEGVQELTTRCADLLAEGQHVSAMQALQQFFEVWRQVQESVLICANALEVKLDSLQIGTQSVAEIAHAVRTQFTDLKSAMEVGDFVLVGDIMRYELATPLQAWNQLIQALIDLPQQQTTPST